MPRHRTPEEKLQIIQEVQREGLSVSRACRKHGISPAVYYLWERRLKQGGFASLKRSPAPAEEGPTMEALEAEIARLKNIITEMAAENLKLKRGLWR